MLSIVESERSYMAVVGDRRTALVRLSELVRVRRFQLQRDLKKAALVAKVAERDFNLIENRSADKVQPPVINQILQSLKLSMTEELSAQTLVMAISVRRHKMRLPRRFHRARRFCRM